jgi:hypothetical protein
LFIFADSSSVGCAKIWTRECGIRDKVEFEYIDYDMSVYAIPHDLSDSEIKRCYDTAFYLHLGDGDFERIRAIDFASYNRCCMACMGFKVSFGFILYLPCL